MEEGIFAVGERSALRQSIRLHYDLKAYSTNETRPDLVLNPSMQLTGRLDWVLCCSISIGQLTVSSQTNEKMAKTRLFQTHHKTYKHCKICTPPGYHCPHSSTMRARETQTEVELRPKLRVKWLDTWQRQSHVTDRLSRTAWPEGKGGEGATMAK